MKGKKQTIVFGVYFLLMTTTFSSFSFIITEIFEKQGKFYIGPLFLASNYGVFLIANTFVPSLRLSYVNQLKLGSVLYTLNYLFVLIPFPPEIETMFLTFGSMLGGLGAALIWVVYGGYIKSLVKQLNE